MTKMFDYRAQLHWMCYQVSKSWNDKWRHLLKVGDRIDFLKNHNGLTTWGIAKIDFIYGNNIELKCENDIERYDKTVNRFSSEIAQFGTCSKSNEWKYGLKIGDIIDANEKW